MTFTHFNKDGYAKMVNIANKKQTTRTAIAQSSITVNREIYQLMTTKKVKKGDVLTTAQIAGIMACKNTPIIIPMCHPILLLEIDMSFAWQTKKEDEQYEIIIKSFVKTKGATGVEMEALTAVSVAALTIYDMCKSVSKEMIIGPTKLLKKTGGQNGDFYSK